MGICYVISRQIFFCSEEPKTIPFEANPHFASDFVAWRSYHRSRTRALILA